MDLSVTFPPPWGLTALRCFDPDRRTFREIDIVFAEGVIACIAPPGTVHSPSLLDGTSYVCAPGMINAHIHPSKDLYNGLYERANATAMLDAVHRNNTVETAVDQAAASLASYAGALRRGITGVGVFTSRAEVDAGAAHRAGVRAQVFYCQNDRWEGGGVAPATRSIPEILAAFDQVRSAFGHGRVGIHPATASEFSASEELLRTLHAVAIRTGGRFSMHAHEGVERVARYRKDHGEGAAQTLMRLGVLDAATTLVHVSALNPIDEEILCASPVSLIHCPASNEFTQAGLMPLGTLLRGRDVGLGTDSGMINPVNDLPCEALLALHGYSRPAVGVADVIDMLTRRGARAIGLSGVGEIREGARADLCLYRVDGNPTDSLDLLRLYLREQPIHVLVDGAFAVRHGRLVDDELAGAGEDLRRRRAAWQAQTQTAVASRAPEADEAGRQVARTPV